MTDLTDLRQRNEELLAANQQLAHDFNNLLQVVSGGLQVLARQPDPQLRDKVLDSMRRAVQRGAALCRQPHSDDTGPPP